MNEHQPWAFTCITCGGHELHVYRVWEILAGPESECWQEWGPLEADHHWHFRFKERTRFREKIEKAEREDAYRWRFAEYIKDRSSPKPEDYEIHEPHTNSGNDRFYVNCASCDREIEFGWAQSNRGGGVFPVECSDFVPGRFWPEPRYLDSWHQKGWLKDDQDGE